MTPINSLSMALDSNLHGNGVSEMAPLDLNDSCSQNMMKDLMQPFFNPVKKHCRARSSTNMGRGGKVGMLDLASETRVKANYLNTSIQ
jgi:hypothetical protein